MTSFLFSWLLVPISEVSISILKSERWRRKKQDEEPGRKEGRLNYFHAGDFSRTTPKASDD